MTKKEYEKAVQLLGEVIDNCDDDNVQEVFKWLVYDELNEKFIYDNLLVD